MVRAGGGTGGRHSGQSTRADGLSKGGPGNSVSLAATPDGGIRRLSSYESEVREAARTVGRRHAAPIRMRKVAAAVGTKQPRELDRYAIGIGFRAGVRIARGRIRRGNDQDRAAGGAGVMGSDVPNPGFLKVAASAAPVIKTSSFTWGELGVIENGARRDEHLMLQRAAQIGSGESHRDGSIV